MLELEDEFGEETVRWALRSVEALVERSETRRKKGWVASRTVNPDPLWDGDLDA